MSHELLAVILAAGKGSRLNLHGIPKPMAEVGGKPVLGHGLELLYKTAFSRESIVVVVGTHKKSIANYCGNDIAIKVQENLDGNLGALDVGLKDSDLKGIDNILVVQADDCLAIRRETIAEMLHFHERRRSDVTLLLTNHYDPSAHRKDYTVANSATIISINKLSGLLGKRNFLAGIFCFSKNFLCQFLSDALRRGAGDKEKTIPSLFDIAMANQRKIYAYFLDGPWIGINTPDQLSKARMIVSELR